MLENILLALVAGSAVNLAFEDIFSKRTLPKPSYLAHIGLILAYLLVAQGLLTTLLFLACLGVVYVATLNKKNVGVSLGDAGLFVILVTPGPIAMPLLLIPTAYVFLKNTGEKIEVMPYIALYLVSLSILALTS